MLIEGLKNFSKDAAKYYVKEGPGQVASGIGDIAEGNIAKGGHKVISGAGTTMLPLAPEAIAANPVMALRGVGGGIVGGTVASAGTKALGGNEDQQKFAGDLGGLAGGTAAATGLLRAVLQSPTKALLTRNKATLDDALDLVFSPKETLKRKLTSMAKDALAPDAAPAAEGTAAGPVPADSGPAPAPYRLSGDQILDAKTATPKRVLGPDRQLPAAPAEQPAAAAVAAPKTAQVLKDAGVTQAMKDAGIAAPSASINAIRPKTGSLGITGALAPRGDISFPPGLSGEDASLMQLTRYSISELRSGALKRGLPVSPKDTHTALIDKIQGSLTPDETAGFTAAAQASKAAPSKFPENNEMAAKLNDAATALQQAKGSPYEIASLRNAAGRIQQHPESIAAVDLTKTKIPGIDKRIGKRIADFLQEQNAVPAGDDQAAGATAGGSSMLEALRQSLINRGIKPPY